MKKLTFVIVGLCYFACLVQAQVLSVGDVILKQNFESMTMQISSDLANVSDTLFQTVVEDGVAKITSTQTRGYYRIVNIPLHNVTKVKLQVSRSSNSNSGQFLYAFYQQGTSSLLWYKITDYSFKDCGEIEFLVNSTLSIKFTTEVNATETFDNIVFTATEVDKSYTRQTTAGKLGTICLPMAVENLTGCGVTFYKIAGIRDDAEGKSIVFGEVSRLEAGSPYIFLSSANQLSLTMSGAGATEPSNQNGLYGTFDRYAFANDANFQEGEYYIINSQNQIQQASSKSGVVANRAFVKISDVPAYNPESQAPGTRLLVLNAEGFTTEVVETSGVDVLPVAVARPDFTNLTGIPQKSPSGLCVCSGKVIFKR